MRKALIAVLVFGASLLLVSSAMAATRFAGPGGTGAEPCASPATPCSIFRAADASGGAVLGDEVILAPGDYSDTAGDLGLTGIVSFEPGISVHGAAGAARPLITLESNPATPAITVNDGDVVSDLEIVTATANTNIAVAGGILEDAIVRSGTDGVGVFACGHTRGLIRDTACISSGAGARAVGGLIPLGAFTLELRNVTAVSTQGRALRYQVGDTADITVNASSVIALSPGADLEAVVVRGKLQIKLDHSVITSFSNSPDAEVIIGDGSVTMARLAPDGVHQLPDSPTIDAGAVDQLSGGTDIDGDSRSLGTAPDIGADELVPAPQPPVTQPPTVLRGGGGSTMSPPTMAPSRPAPTTQINRHPRPQSANRAATISFAADQAGATFECKLDGQPFKRCSSPYKATVKPGRHTFRVRAISAGAADPTPAVFSWKVAPAPR